MDLHEGEWASAVNAVLGKRWQAVVGVKVGWQQSLDDGAQVRVGTAADADTSGQVASNIMN